MNTHDVVCPQCDSLQDYDVAFLGKLGRTTHYRCRYCGWTFSDYDIEPRIPCGVLASQEQKGETS
jgi:transposase-like protein